MEKVIADVVAMLQAALSKGEGNSNSNCNSDKRKKKKKRKKNRNKQVAKLMPGVVSAPSAGYSGMSKIPNFVSNASVGSLPDYSVGWLERHLDPCGEYRTTLDWGKVPDGTIPQSVSGQFREVFTLRYPGANPMVAPLDGQMWSLYGLHLNSWRHAFFFVADMERSEVGDEAVRVARNQFNNTQDLSDAEYPNWVITNMSGVYWTVVAWSAFRNVPPPSAVGVSPFIEQFRITGEGFSMAHNTPSLINQGVIVCAQFNPNSDLRTVVLDSEDDVTTAGYSVQTGIRLNNQISINYTLPGLGPYPWTGSTVLGLSGSTNISAVLAGTIAGPYSSGGNTLYSAGDSLRFQAVELDSGSYTFALQVSTDGTNWTNTLSFGNVGSFSNARIYSGTGSLAVAESHNRIVNAVTLPPVTQEDLIQQTPKTVQYLLKDEQGIYVPKRIWQPVFNMTKASSYAPLRFLGLDTSLNELNTAVGTFSDTLDTNFGISVINITSLPLAAAPYFKVIRSWEAIPSQGSPWGPFTTTTSPKDDIAIVVAKTVSDLDPFAYPYDYNGLGLLFSKVVGVVSKIPRMLRTAANVSDAVAQCCTNVQAAVSRADASNSVRRIGMRRAVLQ